MCNKLIKIRLLTCTLPSSYITAGTTFQMGLVGHQIKPFSTLQLRRINHRFFSIKLNVARGRTGVVLSSAHSHQPNTDIRLLFSYSVNIHSHGETYGSFTLNEGKRECEYFSLIFVAAQCEH